MAHRIPRFFPVFRASPREPGSIPASGACTLGLRTCPPLENPQPMPSLHPHPGRSYPDVRLLSYPLFWPLLVLYREGNPRQSTLPWEGGKVPYVSGTPDSCKHLLLLFHQSPRAALAPWVPIGMTPKGNPRQVCSWTAGSG